jgi:hypothetical protein
MANQHTIDDQDVVPEGKRFSKREWRAYETHKHGLANPRPGQIENQVSPVDAAQMFELYLHGGSCTQIEKQWRKYKLGAIVKAAIEYQWHEKRQEYLEHLHKDAVERGRQAVAESVGFTADLLAVAHKRWGQKLRRYLATGDESELDGFEIRSIDQYRKVVQTFLELTGHNPSEVFARKGTEAGGEMMTAGTVGGLDWVSVASSAKLRPELAAALLSLAAAPPTPEEKQVSDKRETITSVVVRR